MAEPTPSLKKDAGIAEKILLALWALLVVWLEAQAEAYIRRRQAAGMDATRADAMRAAAHWLEGILAGPIGQAVVRVIAREIAERAAAELFPNDPSTGAWGGP